MARSRQNSGAKWPSRPDSARLEPICSPLSTGSFTLEKGETIFTIGSCFARNIEDNLQNRGYKVPSLSFSVPKEELWSSTNQVAGILNKYTPYSMLNEIEFAFGTTDGREFLVEKKEGWLDTQLHTNTTVSLERALERRQQVRELYAGAIRSSRVMVVTLGLIEAWYDAENKTFLNETPDPHILRAYPDRFFFKVLSIEESLRVVSDIVERLRLFGREDQRVIMTVSPVPLGRTFTTEDVICANMYSKSLLRVAAQAVCDRFSWVDYFPSYESVLLSDRALSWQDDLIHVTNKIVAENISRLLTIYE